MKIGIIGSGAMGSGIAQVSAQSGFETLVYDNNPAALENAAKQLQATLNKLAEKGKISLQDASNIFGRIYFTADLNAFSNCGLVVEAIVEDLEVKRLVFSRLEEVVSPYCILASNTSSLSIASLAAACKQPERFIGIHFFNPVPLMQLVEIVPAVQTNAATVEKSKEWVVAIQKLGVMTKDTPGFIVNRVARPFYGEAIRILEEGIADCATIDYAMTSLGGFRMGPFTLMDFIGMDVNYRVTESVWTQFFYEPRFKPSLTQKRLFEAGFYGKKTGRGFYDYQEGAEQPQATQNPELLQKVFERILAMLINEAADAVLYGIGSAADIDLAMTKGVNYPKGLLKWADEWGAAKVLEILDNLYGEYREDRYRASVLLRRAAKENGTFH